METESTVLSRSTIFAIVRYLGRIPVLADQLDEKEGSMLLFSMVHS
jgi:hypothetical protein